MSFVSNKIDITNIFSRPEREGWGGSISPLPFGGGVGGEGLHFLADWNSPSPTMLVHTSGSTGKPKPMHVEKSRMLASARITCDFLGLKAGDTSLLCMPLDYIAGKMMMVRTIERQLSLIAVKPSNHPLADIQQEITLAAMVPSQVYCSLQVAEEREKLMKIRHLIIGGGAISEDMEKELRNFPNAVWSTYGMTETLSHIALRRISGNDASNWYTPFDSVKISLSNEGCLVIDAPVVHDGTLITNDIAEIRADGCFRIIGRKDNVICSGGIKLHIEEIEEKLRPYSPAPFCITKRKDEKFGEIAVLLTTDSSIDWQTCFEKALTPYERPKHIIEIKEIPLTGTGKTDRYNAMMMAMK